MNRIFSFFKKYWLAILAIILFASLLSLYLLLPKKEVPSIIKKPENIKLYKDSIKPGQSVNDLINILGDPTATSEQDQYRVLEYPSLFSKYTSKVYTSEETIELIREPVKYEEKRKIDIYLEQLGEPISKLYDEKLGSSFVGYIYPEEGLAVFAHKIDGIIIEIWYFKPTDLKNFIATWGQDLTEKPPDKPETIK